MDVWSFRSEELGPAHDGTILAQGVFRASDIGAPFSCAFGVLRPGMAQKPERAPVAKVYYVRCGEAVLQVGEETRTIREGDVVFIPANAWHTVRNASDRDFGTFAVWWLPRRVPKDV
jgi:mannose-6-phosphate isomerase-like protein (cupin superfamily)